MSKKIRINKQFVKVGTWKRSFEKQRPMYDELVELLKDTELRPTDPELVANLIDLIVEDMRKTMPPGIDDMELVRMRGQSNLVSRVNEIATTLEHIDLYGSDAALEEYIEEELYTYTSDPDEMEYIETIKTMVHVMKEKFDWTDGKIKDVFSDFSLGFEPYGGEVMFNPSWLGEGVSNTVKRVNNKSKKAA